MHNTLVHALGQRTPGPKKGTARAWDRPRRPFWVLAPGFPGPEHAQECCACTRDLLCMHKRFLCVYTRDFLCMNHDQGHDQGHEQGHDPGLGPGPPLLMTLLMMKMKKAYEKAYEKAFAKA